MKSFPAFRARCALSTLFAVGVVAAGALASPAQPPAASESTSYGVPNERHPEPGWVFGGQPSADTLTALAKGGFRVLDLRTEGEDRGMDEPRVLADLGVDYRNIPVSGELLREGAVFDQVFAELERGGDQPLLVHCASGNRVGALYYAWLVAHEGVDKTEALERARANGLRSTALVELVDSWLSSHESQ